MLIYAIIFGILQGLTEFLPVSSSGHLAIAHMLFPGFKTPELVFEVLVHLATAIAVVIFLRSDIIGMIKSLFKTNINEEDRINRRLILFIIIASIPTGIIGLLLKDFATDSMKNPMIVMAAYLVTGTLLIFSLIKKTRNAGLAEITWIDAVIIGTMQGLAVIPGISRSGSTIVIALLIGITPMIAARLSFLLSLPAIFGALLLEIKDVSYAFSMDSAQALQMAAGMLAAGIVGYIALKIIVSATRSLKLHLFAPYCYLLAVLILVWKVL